MINKVILRGRLTRDNDVRYTAGENSSATLRNSVAIGRKYKNKEGGYDADFPNIVAFGRTAEFIDKHFKKGDLIDIVGRIQTGKYTNKDGQTVYTTDVIVEEVDFGNSSKNDNQSTSAPQNNQSLDLNIPEGTNEELPF